MEFGFIIILTAVSFWSEFFSYFFEISGLKDIEKLEREITFNNF